LGLPVGELLAQVELQRATPNDVAPSTQPSRVTRAPLGVNDGKGILFVSHKGDVQPSGFLNLVAGNVRQRSLVDIYRDTPVFRQLRDPEELKGKCGLCEFKSICGGSRARAFAVTGDPLASDPYCVYQPPAWRERRGAANRSDDSIAA
jgi:radical SAM protein with 4Fe4S-binding SPASM domain